MATSNESPYVLLTSLHTSSNESPYVSHTVTLMWKSRAVKYRVVKIPGKMEIVVHRYLPAAILLIVCKSSGRLIVCKSSGREQPCGVPQIGISSDNSPDSCQFLWKTGS